MRMTAFNIYSIKCNLIQSVYHTLIVLKNVYDMIRGCIGLKNPFRLRSTNNGGFASGNLTVVKYLKQK